MFPNDGTRHSNEATRFNESGEILFHPSEYELLK
jgi:hypothetical protein